MSLYDTKNDLKTITLQLPKKYEDYNIDELANSYCEAVDNNDAHKKNLYLSALILRFWYVIDKIYLRVKSFGYDREDVFFNVYECIEAACHYRAWQNPDKKTNAQACINQVISSRGVPALVCNAKLQKNTRASLSLDDPISDDGDSTFGDTIIDEQAGIFDGAKATIQALISDNKVIEAIIADKIAYNDVFKHFKKTKVCTVDNEEYKYVEHKSEFWPFKVVQELNSIDESYKSYFLRTYSINTDILDKAIEALSMANNQKKYRLISKSKETIKNFI